MLQQVGGASRHVQQKVARLHSVISTARILLNWLEGSATLSRKVVCTNAPIEDGPTCAGERIALCADEAMPATDRRARARGSRAGSRCGWHVQGVEKQHLRSARAVRIQPHILG